MPDNRHGHRTVRKLAYKANGRAERGRPMREFYRGKFFVRCNIKLDLMLHLRYTPINRAEGPISSLSYFRDVGIGPHLIEKEFTYVGSC